MQEAQPRLHIPKTPMGILDHLLKAELPISQQVPESAAFLAIVFAIGWLLHDEYQLTPVLLCLVASIFLSLITDIRVALFSCIISALAADYFFIGPPGSIHFDFHFILRGIVFLGTSVSANLLVSLLRRAYLQSVDARTAAEKANREKDELLAILSHDLRSPLTSAQLSLQLLERTIFIHDTASLKHVLRARESCRRVNSLVLDLLDSSSIASHGLTIHPDTHDISQLVASVGAELKVVAEKAGVTLELPTSPSISLRCDANRVCQVISNIVGNALKFTSRGGKIKVNLESRPHEVLISVADTGIGMTECQMKHAFERFWQAERTARSGMGLGLYIVKAIVDAHRGKVEVSSTPGKGTVFKVSLPC